MKLNRRDISTIKDWCLERNHCKKPISDSMRAKIEKGLDGFPYNKSMRTIDEYWGAELDVGLTTGEIEVALSCIYDNTAMEDANLPMDVVNKLQILKAETISI